MQPRAGKKPAVQSSLESLQDMIQSISAPECQKTSEKGISDLEPEALSPNSLQNPVQIHPSPNFPKNSFGYIDDGSGMNINLNSNIISSLGS
jgi:hypothetical protein